VAPVAPVLLTDLKAPMLLAATLILVAFFVLILVDPRLRRRLFNLNPWASPQGSVFIKLSAAATKEAEANGRIIAIDAANAAKHIAAKRLEGEASRVHSESDAVVDRFTDILASL
jgi:hypothetical protein